MGDTKKIVVLAALFLVMITVGVFQFVKMSGPPAAAVKPAVVAPPVAQVAADPPQGPKYPGLVDLPEKDPFEAPYVAPPAIVKPAVNSGSSNHVGPSSAFLQGLKTQFPTGSLPFVTGGARGSGDQADGVGIRKIEEPKFGYSLAGILLGRHPLAVFRDEKTGTQRLTALGQQIDSESKLVSLDSKAAKVLFNGKEQFVKLEGGTVAKQ